MLTKDDFTTATNTMTVTGTCSDCPASCTDADIRTPQGGEWCRICSDCRRADAEFAGEAERMIETAFGDAPDATEPGLVECAICTLPEDPAAMTIYHARLICFLCLKREVEDDARNDEEPTMDEIRAEEIAMGWAL